MKNEKLIIIALIIIIFMVFTCIFLTRENVGIDVDVEGISNTSDFYIICQITDSKGNPIDTNFGKLNIALTDENSSGVVYSDLGIYHGKAIIRDCNRADMINVYYDGGYFYKPSSITQKFEMQNETNLTDDNITINY